MTRIISFNGAYNWLSNFYIEPDGSHVEGEYQALKSDPPTEALRHLRPGEAKKKGRKVSLRPDWDAVKLSIMEELVRRKFADHPSLALRLIATRGAHLEEGNWWGDRFWGTVNGVGENHLGKILMMVRKEFL